MEPNEGCIIEGNSGDRHLDGNGVPGVAYTGHIVWAACQIQHAPPLNRPCRRDCPERKHTTWGPSSCLSCHNNHHLSSRRVCLPILRRNGGGPISLYVPVPPHLIRYPRAASSGGSRTLPWIREETSKPTAQGRRINMAYARKATQHSSVPITLQPPPYAQLRGKSPAILGQTHTLILVGSGERLRVKKGYSADPQHHHTEKHTSFRNLPAYSNHKSCHFSGLHQSP
jgi:hypothetical protein